MEVLVKNSFCHTSGTCACNTGAAKCLAGSHAQSSIWLNKSVVSPEHWKLPVTARPHVQVTCWAGTVGCDTSVQTPVGAALPCQAQHDKSAKQAERRSVSTSRQDRRCRQPAADSKCCVVCSLCGNCVWLQRLYACRHFTLTQYKITHVDIALANTAELLSVV